MEKPLEATNSEKNGNSKVPNFEIDADLYEKHAMYIPELGTKIMKEILDPKKGQKILDIGCGEGSITKKIQEITQNVVGVDLSQSMVDKCKQKGLEAYKLDATYLDEFFQENTFDGIFSNSTLHWLKKDPERVIQGAHKILKNGGKFAAEFGAQGNCTSQIIALEAAFQKYLGKSAYDTFPWYFPQENEYKSLLEKNGFKVQKIKAYQRPTILEGGLRDVLTNVFGSYWVGLNDQQIQELALGKNDQSQAQGKFVWHSRYTIVLLTFIAFMLCNMDRVNMSIAIMPMRTEYNWSIKTVGLIQSSFFWGYLLTQILGGIWADQFGGKRVLGFGVVWWSLATALTPVAARMGLIPLLIVRTCMGIGEGVAMPAMNNMISKWVPLSERSRSLAFVYSGMHVGSVIALLASPKVISSVGWSMIFYGFGSLGIVWFIAWVMLAKDNPEAEEDPQKEIIADNLQKEQLKDPLGKTQEFAFSIPWKKILTTKEVWAIIVCHFCHNYGLFILLTWMPTYYTQVLHFNLQESGIYSVLPWLTMALVGQVAGFASDAMIGRGYSVSITRKIMQTVGFLGPAFFLSQLQNVSTPFQAVVCMMFSQGLDSFSHSGLYSNHQDIGPKYSGILLGLSNTAGVLAGVVGTAATGVILNNGSWNDVWKVAIILYLVGTIVWNTFSKAEKVLD